MSVFFKKTCEKDLAVEMMCVRESLVRKDLACVSVFLKDT